MRRFGRTVAAAAMGVALLAGACGGDGDGGGSASSWRSSHAKELDALSRDLIAADNALAVGERTAIQGSCKLLADSSRDFRASALPVPDKATDTALADALTAIDKAAQTCLAGTRTGQAHEVETAMDEMDKARVALDKVDAALAAWK